MRKRLSLLLALLLTPVLTVTAQERPSAQVGSLIVTDWPNTAVDEGILSTEQVEEATLLPEIDSLRLGYELVDREGSPRLFVQLAWTHGHYGWIDGERVAHEALPADARMAALELHARATAGEEVTDFYLRLDGLDLASSPAVYEATLDTLAWSDLFPQLSEDEGRQRVADGFTLERPQILSATFITDDEGFYTQVAQRPDDGRTRRRQPEPTVVTVDPGVWIDIWVVSPPRRIYDHPRRSPSRPRGNVSRGADEAEPSGGRSRPTRRAGVTERDHGDRSNDGDGQARRADTTRSGRGLAGLFDGKDDDKDDDDKDDESLLPAALVGVAAVGVLAYAAGTIGYYGNAADAPIGLTAGYVRRGGGVLLQVAVNSAVISQDDDVPEHLIAKVTGFADVFQSPLRPAMGLGAYAEEFGGEVEVSPSVSLGGVWQQGPTVIYVGYDVAANGLDVGLAFNFRQRRSPSPR